MVLRIIICHTHKYCRYVQKITLNFSQDSKYKHQNNILLQKINKYRLHLYSATFNQLKFRPYNQENICKNKFILSVIKVKWTLSLQQENDFSPIHHKYQKCILSFFQAMKKTYGTEINWFKALGGLTIAITLEKKSFMKGIMRAMKGTSHSKCYNKICQQFFKQTTSIYWLTFMNTIKRLKQILKLEFKQGIIQAKSLKCIQRDISKQKQIKKIISPFSQNSDEKGLSLQFQKCKLYKKEDLFDTLSFIKLRKTDNFLRKRSFSVSSNIRAKTSMSEQKNSFYKDKKKSLTNKSVVISTTNIKQIANQQLSLFFPTQTAKDLSES